MIILNYLLAISLVLLSVVKTAELFILSNKVLEKTETKFVNHTRSYLKNHAEKGNISLTAAFLTALLSLLLLFYISKMKIDYQEAVYRKESYLCFQYLNLQTIHYIKEMAIFNWSLRSAFIAQASVIATAEAAEIFKGLIISRNIRHFYYLKKLTTNRFCQLSEIVPYIKNIPFKTQSNLALITNKDETSIIRTKKWAYSFYKIPNGIRLKKSFCLKSDFQIQNAFLPRTTYATSEIQIMGLLNLKCLSGPS